MSERMKKSVGAICICCNINDRGARTESDPDWLEVNGHPTIPHVQSIRAPPAPIALRSKKDNMLGISNKTVSRRYLEKLQRERERNQEVLADCIDNLPITIKQLVYPEKPSTKDASRYSTINSIPSRETKFRVGRPNDYWQEGADQWVNDANPSDHGAPPNHQQKRTSNGRNCVRESSHHSKSTTDGAFLNKDYVHYPGFQGASGQSQSLRYKFGKKSGVAAESPTKPPPVKFKPKGYGSLYDELEFERRYKKVFDLNKHIHFVHSNYLSGQRLMKRSKLPPIGYNPSIQSDPMDTGDIFAIMSVQKYNHPSEFEKTRVTLSNPGSGLRKSDGLYDRRSNRPKLEVSQSLDTPIGFVPGTIPKTGSSPFDGINGNCHDITMENVYRLQSFLRDESHQQTSTNLVTKDEESSPHQQSHKQNSKTKLEEEKVHVKTPRKKPPRKQESAQSVDLGSEAPDDTEPFNIRVHVAIRPQKEAESSEHDSEKSAHASQFQTSMSPNRSRETSETEDKNELHDTFEEKIVYPTRLDSYGTNEHVHVDPETHVVRNITPRNIQITTNQFGIVTKKVQYPPNFVVDGLAETGESDKNSSRSEAMDSLHPESDAHAEYNHDETMTVE